MELPLIAPKVKWNVRLSKSIHNEAYRKLIGELIAARKAAGITQQTLADGLGKPQSYVAKVEGFERRLDVVEYLTMAREIGVDPMPVIKATWNSL